MADLPDFSTNNSLSSPLDNLKSDFLGQLNSKQKSTIVSDASPLPWAGGNSVFWQSLTIDPDRWDQLYPYRLVVVDSANGNQIVAGVPQVSFKASSSFNPSIFTGNSSATTQATDGLSFEAMNSQWVFALPITPQQLNITDQYAINTSATLRGIIEEHGGLKFKMITASGTFGVWPFRESTGRPPGSPSPLTSVFGGTIEAAQSALSSVAKVINSATSNSAASKPTTVRPEASQAGIASTGYYMALSMQQFLEQYAEAKLNPACASWRLVFDIPKQNQSFVVTPMPFSWIQNEAKPMFINYNMSFKAWRRVDLKQKVSPANLNVQPISPGILQRVLNTITAARAATSSVVNLIGAVRSDVEAPLDALRQTSLLVKDLVGAAITAADLPFQVQRDYKSGINDFFTSLSINNLTGAPATDPAVAQALSDLQLSATNKEGVSMSAVSGGQLGNSAASGQSIDPSQNPLNNPAANFSLMDQAPIDNLVLSVAQQNQVSQVIEDARNLTVDDLKKFRATIQSLAIQLSNNFGSGDAFVSQVYNLPPPVTRVTPITIDNYELLKVLYDSMQAYDILTATTQINDDNLQTNMEYVAGLAFDSDIPFQISNSKILAPVPFGLTIEGIAGRYLGDPQRWLEIVTLNNLRDPYIDENGFQLPLLSNATGRQITVSDASLLFLKQKISLQSSTQSPSARTILGIDKLSDTSFLITLDGLPNLDNFVTVDKAYVQAYLAGTVNSQQKIFIPTNATVQDSASIVTPAVATSDPMTGLSKVDLLLTDTGDLAINSFGDLRYAYGMTNIIQALKIKMGSIKGTLLLHPDFGFGVSPGTINGSLDARQIFDSINKLITEDPRFEGVSRLEVSIAGPLLNISMAVTLAGRSGVFPITFQLVA